MGITRSQSRVERRAVLMLSSDIHTLDTIREAWCKDIPGVHPPKRFSKMDKDKLEDDSDSPGCLNLNDLGRIREATLISARNTTSQRLSGLGIGFKRFLWSIWIIGTIVAVALTPTIYYIVTETRIMVIEVQEQINSLHSPQKE